MGMDLADGKRYFSFSSAFWFDVLELGRRFGWEPLGTGPPAGGRLAGWDGRDAYYGNDGQRFYARDARALARALERALAALGAGGGKRSTRPTRRAQAADFAVAALSGRRAPRRGRVAARELTPEDLLYIRKFIRFCRAGGFRIY
jgi:hypothetical protein